MCTPGISALRTALLGALAGAGLSAAGCQEWVHMGQISDREAAWAVANVQIDQHQPDGTWKSLGSTDGNGRWWIIKEKIKGGGKIRLSRGGYLPIYLGESEFLQQNNIIMYPEAGGGTGAGGDPFERGGPRASPRP